MDVSPKSVILKKNKMCEHENQNMKSFSKEAVNLKVLKMKF